MDKIYSKLDITEERINEQKTLKINHPNWSIIENIMNKSSVNLENIVIEILEREMWGRKKQLDR